MTVLLSRHREPPSRPWYLQNATHLNHPALTPRRSGHCKTSLNTSPGCIWNVEPIVGQGIRLSTGCFSHSPLFPDLHLTYLYPSLESRLLVRYEMRMLSVDSVYPRLSSMQLPCCRNQSLDLLLMRHPFVTVQGPTSGHTRRHSAVSGFLSLPTATYSLTLMLTLTGLLRFASWLSSSHGLLLNQANAGGAPQYSRYRLSQKPTTAVTCPSP